MKLKNEIMLITYADSLGKNLKDLHTVLDKYYKEAVGGVHILPFFPSYSSSGFILGINTLDVFFSTTLFARSTACSMQYS